MLQGGKITKATARVNFIKSCKNVEHHLRNLQALERAEREAELAERMVRVQKELEANYRRCKDYPVVNKWLQSFESLRDRYSFLVIVGASGLGKTQFVKSMAGSLSNFLEVNCAACDEPDLRNFAGEGVVLLDEASPAMVIRQKRLMQAPACMVLLGASATNCHAYKVWVHRTKFVICSNDWDMKVADLKEPDQAWLAANSIKLLVTDVMWDA